MRAPVILRLPVLLLCCLIAATGAARAVPHFATPWPEGPAAEAATVARDVTLASSDPFVPADIGHAPARRVAARLYLPRGARPDRATPAVVLLHGSVGDWQERGDRYGYPLAAQGVAVLVVESYASRPDLGQSFLARVLHITETMFVADAYAGLRYLAARPEIDARHVALIGFSYGGMAATYAIYDQMARALAPDGERFAAHVAYYAPCIARFRDSRTTGAPLLMLYGGRDQLIDPARCARVAADLRAGGSAVRVIVYPDAVHQWDGERPLGVIGRHLADCSFEVNRDGTVTDNRTLLPMSGPFTRKVILALCTGSRPYPIGRDEMVARESNRDLAAFLERVFGGKG